MVEVKNQVWCSRFIEGINENTKFGNGYVVAWLRLLVTRPNNGSAGKTNEGEVSYRDKLDRCFCKKGI